MSKTESFEKLWEEQLQHIPDEDAHISLPLHVLVHEAAEVSKFFTAYWEPEIDPHTKKVTRPGLVSANGTKHTKSKPTKDKLPETLGTELLELLQKVQTAQTDYLLTIDTIKQGDPVERGRVVLREITAVLEWFFDDGVEDLHDEQLASLGTAHQNDPDSASALASALHDYATLADTHRDDLDGLGDFEVTLIDEAISLAKQLRGLSTANNSGSTEQPKSHQSTRAQALLRRNKLAVLLLRKMNQVRAAARFVFRAHPKIIREATSAYERKKRRARKTETPK